jgi:hypothetical protein
MKLVGRRFRENVFVICFAAAIPLLLGKPVQVHAADEGGYVDLSFTCDFTTTCPHVCAKSAEECPSQLKCNGTDSLCSDGSCATFCAPSLTSPCEEISACAPVTCSSIDTFYETCKTEFGPWYEYANACPDLMIGDDVPQVEARLSWTKTEYLVVYSWVSALTAAMVAWCWYK